jgi:hypothetical protein
MKKWVFQVCNTLKGIWNWLGAGYIIIKPKQFSQIDNSAPTESTMSREMANLSNMTTDEVGEDGEEDYNEEDMDFDLSDYIYAVHRLETSF